MPNMIVKVTMYNPDKTLFYRHESEWVVLSDAMRSALGSALEKQHKMLDEMRASQRNDPVAGFHVTIEVTDAPTLSYSEFTYDMWQKTHREWNSATEALLREAEKQYAEAQRPPPVVAPPIAPPPGTPQPLPTPPHAPTRSTSSPSSPERK